MSALLPAAGLIEGDAYRFPVRVYYEDTDAGGVVYHAAYLRFAERARSEFLMALGWSHDRLQAEARAQWAVHRLDITYRAPARLGDALIVEARLLELGASVVKLVQHIGRDGTALARLTVNVVLVGPAGRPTRLPPALRAALAPYLTLSAEA